MHGVRRSGTRATRLLRFRTAVHAQAACRSPREFTQRGVRSDVPKERPLSSGARARLPSGLGEIEVNNPPSIMAEDDQGVEDPKRRRCNDEHVDRDNVSLVVLQKGAPGRGGDVGAPWHVSPDRGLADFDTKLEQFAWIRGAPQSGLTRLIGRIRSRVSELTLGRPAERCHWITVAGFTSTMAFKARRPNPVEPHPD
jgi:hypothetical protein